MIRRWYAPYGHRAVWSQSLYLLTDLAVGIGLFTAFVTLLSTGLGLAITVVGIPLLAVTVWGGRLVGQFEAARMRALLGRDLPAWPAVQWGTGWWVRTRQALADGPGWRGVAYSMLMLPWGILTFTLTVTLWSLAAGLVSSPLWRLWSDAPPPFVLNGHKVSLDQGALMALSVVACMLGLLLLAALPRLIAGLAALDVRLASALLAPDPTLELQQRVSVLTESRDASVASAAGELRRIERDLHDGAQQRLVSLAMNLGMAKERMADVEDPKARELVASAHEEAKQAIAELRDLVRGIHPAVLTDRGLDAAVSALVARCPVPVELTSDLGGRRLPPACEATAYFVVAEALTNVAKHSQARRARVRLAQEDGVLVVEIADDGVGGAAEGPSGGLHGLHDRVLGVEGRLRIASPDGGPTTLIVELPCAS